MSGLKIDYVEFATGEVAQSKAFFAQAFGWAFTDYGPTYQAFANAGLDGGLNGEADPLTPPLVILKADDLEGALADIEAAGGEIVVPVYAFPGGRRFHFREPGGNVLAVWSAD